MHRRTLALLLLVFVAPRTVHAQPAPAPAPAPAPTALAHRPRLVVFIAVDQMRAEYLDRFKPLYSAGLKRLGDEGAVFTNAMYRHACTETGPGHSVLMSGRSPRSSGGMCSRRARPRPTCARANGSCW